MHNKIKAFFDKYAESLENDYEVHKKTRDGGISMQYLEFTLVDLREDNYNIEYLDFILEKIFLKTVSVNSYSWKYMFAYFKKDFNEVKKQLV